MWRIGLDKANLIGNIQSLDVAGQTNIGLFGSIWADQSINTGSINIVQSLDGALDVLFVGTHIDNEHKSVVLFDFAHGAFSGQWELDNTEVIQIRIFGDRFPWIFRGTSQL